MGSGEELCFNSRFESGNLEQVKQIVEGSVVVLRELQDASVLVEGHSQTLSRHIQAFKLD